MFVRRLPQCLCQIGSVFGKQNYVINRNVNLHLLTRNVIPTMTLTSQQQKRLCSTNVKTAEESTKETENLQKLQLGKLQGKLQLIFTCKKCSTRNNKMISKLAYDKGVVIVRCEGCKNNHLIADNLGWFEEWKHCRNIETFLKYKGEKVSRIRNDVDGYFEAIKTEEIEKAHEIYNRHKADEDTEK